MMGFLLDCLAWAVAALPLRMSRCLMSSLARIVFAVSPRRRAIIETNLKLAFPDQTPEARRLLMQGMCISLGKLIVDVCRLPTLDDEWMRTHVEIPDYETLKKMVDASPKGMMLASAHVGSFELLA